MSDDLTVTSGWMVDTDNLTAAAMALGRWSASLQDLRARLQFATREHAVQYILGTPVGHRADRTTDHAVTMIEQAIGTVSQLSLGLQLAARGYELTEATVAGMAEATAALQSMVAIGGGIVLAAGLLPLVGLALATRAATGDPVDLNDLAKELRRSGVLSDPRTVTVARAVVSGADDAVLALAGVPAPVALTLGDSGSGMVTTEATAAAVLGMTGAASVRAVQVRATALPAVPAPTGIDDLAARVPYGREGQVRIERYPADGAARYVVYIDGTRDAGMGTTAEPFDMASNLAGIAGVDGAAARSTERAMRLAGIGPDDPVLFAGYSQGGLVAARLAQSGDYRAVGLVTFGSPVGQLELPSMPVLSLEHREDLVPALGGVDGSGAAVGRVTVSRSLYDGSPPDDWAPAHQISTYRETAGLVDGSTDPRLADMRRLLSQFTGTATATEFAARRAGQ